MTFPSWRSVLRWLLVPILSFSGLVPAGIGLSVFFVRLERVLLRITNQLRIPPQIADHLVSVLLFASLVFLWTSFTAAAIYFALKKPIRRSLVWAITAAVLLSTPFLCAVGPAPRAFASHFIAVAIGIVLTCGAACSVATGKRSIQTLANVVALVLITVPSLMGWATFPKQPPSAREVWSAVLQRGTWQATNTGDEFGATRHAVFSGDRVVAIFDTGDALYEGDKPMSKYRMVSLDRKTGVLKGSTDFIGRWGGAPYIFATGNGHIIVSGHVMTSLNPDLSPSGIQSDSSCRLAHNISTDGTAMACETTSGTIVLDTSSLKPTGIRLSEFSPVAISRNAALTTHSSWEVEYPDGKAFITLTDQHGRRPIYHGQCAGTPSFLKENRVLFLGCGSLRVLDFGGKTIAEHVIETGGKLAGISQDGKRFALQYSAEKGDFPIILYERFVIYDAESLSAIAVVDSKDFPARRSWSALSGDGKYFLSGSPERLTLYELP